MKGKKVLVATDLSDNAQPAARVGKGLAALFGDDVGVEVMHVIDMTERDLTRLKSRNKFEILSDPDRRQEAEQRVASWYVEAAGRSENVTINLVVGGPTDQEIRDRATSDDVACLVIAMSGRGAWSRFIFGSTAIRLAGRPPTTLAVAHPEHHRTDGELTIAVGTDFTETSVPPLEEGVWLARKFDAPLHLVHSHALPSTTIINEGELPEGMRRTEIIDWAEDSMQQFVERHAELLEDVDYHTHVMADHPVAGLRQFVIDHGVDWLVLGDRKPEDRHGAVTVKGKWVQEMNCSTLIVSKNR